MVMDQGVTSDVSGRRLANDFAELALKLQGEPEAEPTLGQVLKAAQEMLGCDVGGVMLVVKGKVESAYVTNEIVERADALQLRTGDGPCLEAIEERETFTIVDTTTETRWPLWCAGVAELGIRSVLSVQLQTERGVLGALNLYSYEPNSFGRDDAWLGTILASHASIALAAGKERAELRQAIDGRHVIGMAQGILMERFTLGEAQAFAVLRRYSQDRNIKLREVAQQVVNSRTLPA
ncbi:GAF and ANTAR domain-containing protein [Gephyromycinifex aptenodytis]|uniref:GAF and ANTAR domain-containing protein n=1 Tax=Gephyromycinifex aptenodytis TaxID=2716227 RepID=UPI001D0046DE|nr:GAF and ANTAR domain-containing protein [Gephyromycinifex aptenodytis]